ncbi:MAG: hypothetical protein HOP29_10160 [Phycisphaerales bacterium]|nr:hypothetical protein [Phycisphaerales bacterium]
MRQRSDSPAGWIKSLKFVAGRGLSARIEWAGDVADMIYHKVYRYLSPVWYRDAHNRIVGLKNVGLVNEPAIHGYRPLANAKGTKGIIVNSATAESTGGATGAPIANATDAGDGMDSVIARCAPPCNCPTTRPRPTCCPPVSPASRPRPRPCPPTSRVSLAT